MPRLNKRQQRELDELEALSAGPSNLGGLGGSRGSSDVDDEVLEETRNKPRASSSGFAALFTSGDNDDAEEDEEEDEPKAKSPKSKKSKKKKKGGVKPTEELPLPSKPTPKTPSTSIPPQSNEKKAAKKAKAKAKKNDMDEIDRALAELSIKHPEYQRAKAKAENTNTSTSTSTSTSSLRALSSLLSVSLPHLDSDLELRKFFGSKVVFANKPKPSPSSSSPSRSPGTGSRRQNVTQRSNLTKPQASWGPLNLREGLSSRPLTEVELDEKMKRQRWDGDGGGGGGLEEKWWTVEYSKRYKSMTMAFMRTVLSGDPQGFHNLLRRTYWQADTWLQLSEVFRHNEEHAQAVDAVDRALFAYERAFVGAFNFTSGINRLDFDRVENRPFFLAIHRQTSDLQRRGCVRAAFEFARLMYSLDPWNDPHGALFHLEYLAVKAGMGQWLVDVYCLFEERAGKGENRDSRMDPSVLPGWMYSRALALRNSKKVEDQQASTAALVEAINSFPSVVPLLADKLDVSIPGSIRSHRDFRIETDGGSLSTPNAILHLLSHLYVQRSFSIWKPSSSWFTSTLVSYSSSLPSSSSIPPTPTRTRFLTLYGNTPSLQYSAYRHVLVLESSYQRLLGYIPRAILGQKGLSCDPLPPPGKVTEYDSTFFEGVEDLERLGRGRTREERVADERRLGRLIPNVDLRRQIQAVFEGNPVFGDRFPGGVLQFAQALEQMAPEALDDMMMFAAMENEVLEDRGMPGNMPGFEDEMMGDGVAADGGGGEEEEDHEEEEDEEEEDEDVAPLPVRVLRNILGRFWGGNGNSRVDDDDDSSDEEEGDTRRMLRDDAGVD